MNVVRRPCTDSCQVTAPYKYVVLLIILIITVADLLLGNIC